ncbi:MAG: ABC transporter permease [Rubrivivax sp.]|nr:ABC transporter permease [Rubrivivax sp.]
MIFLRNVLRAPVRSLMTVLGIAAGVAMFTAVSAITADLRTQIAGAVDAYQIDVVVYERRAPSPFSSKITREQMRSLTDEYGPALAPMVIGTLNEKWNPYALVMGVEPAFAGRMALVAGRQMAAPQGEALLGELGAQRMGLQPGAQIPIGGKSHVVTGIFRTGSRLFDGGVMLGAAQARQLFAPEGSEGQYTLALLHTGDRAATARVIDEVQRHHPALRAIPATEFAGALRLFRVVDAFVGTIAVVALVGTVLVVTNTLLMAVAERTREIGILMAVGWTPWLVLRMLLAESVLLCLAGAALGNAVGLALLHAVNGMESVGFGWIPVRLSPPLVATSFALTLAVAVLALAWPAIVLWRMQPLTALRHE